MQFSVRLEYPNGATHVVKVDNPARGKHFFWGPQVTRASQVTLECEGPWAMERTPTGAVVRYEGQDADHWNIGHNLEDLGTRTWMYDHEKYEAFWDDVWTGILYEGSVMPDDEVGRGGRFRHFRESIAEASLEYRQLAAAPEMYDLLKEIQFKGYSLEECPICSQTEFSGHAEDCRLAAVLKAVEGE